MHDDRPHADSLQKDDVNQQVAQLVWMLQDAAAELDDDVLISELANPTEGFDQNVGLQGGREKIDRHCLQCLALCPSPAGGKHVILRHLLGLSTQAVS